MTKPKKPRVKPTAKPKAKKHDPAFTVVNTYWEYLLRTETWRSFPRDGNGNRILRPDGTPLMLTHRRKYLDMRSRTNGTIVEFKYFLHQGTWKWQVDGKACHGDDIFGEMLMRCGGDRMEAKLLLEACMNQAEA